VFQGVGLTLNPLLAFGKVFRKADAGISLACPTNVLSQERGGIPTLDCDGPVVREGPSLLTRLG
jgi:hypothetical protein